MIDDASCRRAWTSHHQSSHPLLINDRCATHLDRKPCDFWCVCSTVVFFFHWMIYLYFESGSLIKPWSHQPTRSNSLDVTWSSLIELGEVLNWGSTIWFSEDKTGPFPMLVHMLLAGVDLIESYIISSFHFFENSAKLNTIYHEHSTWTCLMMARERIIQILKHCNVHNSIHNKPKSSIYRTGP